MPFTDQCDVFVSIGEEAINRVIGHIQRQRPSLYNYGTAAIVAKPELLCQRIEPHPVVGQRLNPFVTELDPLPIPGSVYTIDYALQLVKLEIDFHPGDKFALPPELGPKLPEQRFALHIKVCAGLGCPPKELIDQLIPRPQGKTETKVREEPDIPIPIPSSKLRCFCIDAYTIGGFRMPSYGTSHYLEPFVDSVEIVDITPSGLEDSLECYLILLLKLSVMPKLRILLGDFSLQLLKNVAVVLKPVVPPAVANNPALEENQLKAYIALGGL